MTQHDAAEPEPSITASQLTGLLGAVDFDKLRDADGAIDSVKVATMLAHMTGSATTPPAPPARRGPTATGHNAAGARRSRGLSGSGREMFEQRHRRAKYDDA